MTVKLASLRANLEREEAGDWVDSRSFLGVRFNVSALTKPSFAIKRDQVIQKLARRFKGKTPPGETTKAIGGLFADEILHNWDGFDIPYSKEAAFEALTDPAHRDLVAEIEYCASTLSNVDAEYVEEELGKSESPSARSSKSATKSGTSSET